MADDDVYVHVPNLLKRIPTLRKHAPYMWGIPGCGPKAVCTKKGRVGLCGGGGYLLSKQNLGDRCSMMPATHLDPSPFAEKMVSPLNLEDWMELWMEMGETLL